MSSPATENVVGAVIFFSYIVAALFFTGLIGRDLIILNSKENVAKPTDGSNAAERDKKRQKAHIFFALSAISFAVLSFQMLSFLVLSFLTWRKPGWQLAADTVLGKDNLLNQSVRQWVLLIWTWSKQSTLFKDFAENLVQDSFRFFWTQQTLIYSLGWNIYMAVEGTRCQIPHLWAYFVLDQILPVSFTQNLFCTALILGADPPSSSVVKAAAPGDQFVVVFAYLLSLSMIHRTVGTGSFFVLLFAIRALLFAPYLMMRPSIEPLKPQGSALRKGVYWQYRYSASVLVVGGLFLIVSQLTQVRSIVGLMKAMEGNPAVAALAFDYIIGVFSLAIFVFSGGVSTGTG